MADLFQELHKDHEEVRSIFSKLKEEGDSGKRKSLLDQLREELLPHMKAEEKTVYPELLRQSEAKEDALESIEEHHASEMVLRELMSLSPDDERFRAKVSVLKEMIDHHVDEEEEKIFKDLKQSFDSSKLGDLLKSFRSAKKDLKGSA